MAIKQAVWVHGNAFSPPERPGPGPFQNVAGIHWTDVCGLHRGWGVTWRGSNGTDTWFHVPIPTPVIVNDVRLKLAKVFVMYDFPSGALLKHVHVWDGHRRVHTFGEFNLSGNNCGQINTQNTFELPPHVGQPEVWRGLGLSVRVKFNADTDITWCGAGADFV